MLPSPAQYGWKKWGHNWEKFRDIQTLFLEVLVQLHTSHEFRSLWTIFKHDCKGKAGPNYQKIGAWLKFWNKIVAIKFYKYFYVTALSTSSTFCFRLKITSNPQIGDRRCVIGATF